MFPDSYLVAGTKFTLGEFEETGGFTDKVKLNINYLAGSKVASKKNLDCATCFVLELLDADTNKRIVKFHCHIVINYLWNSSDEPDTKIKEDAIAAQAWPYFREFVEQSIAKMKSRPILLPAVLPNRTTPKIGSKVEKSTKSSKKKSVPKKKTTTKRKTASKKK